MARQLTQGQNIGLKDVAAGASRITIGVGWTLSPGTPGEVDVSAFLLGTTGRVRSDGDFVFYNNPSSPDGGVVLENGAGADLYQLRVDLERVSAVVSRIALALTMDAEGQPVSFSNVRACHVRVMNNDREVVRYDIATAGMSEAAIIAAELYRHGSEWKLRAVGQGFNGGLGPLASSLGVDVEGHAAPPVSSATAPTMAVPALGIPAPATATRLPSTPAGMTDDWRSFGLDGQDLSTVRSVYERLVPILLRDETLLYMAVQRTSITNLLTDSICLTNRRVLVFHPKIVGGMTVQDFKWADISAVHMNEGIRRANMVIQPKIGAPITANELTKVQARRAHAIAKEQLEESQTAQRRESEPAGEDPVRALKQLKELLDAGIVSQAEYEAKRQAILARL